IVFEGIIGDGYRGDIAIDDISIRSGSCSDCDFNDDFCNWMQFDGDNFDWDRGKGITETWYTGPNGDHTSGVGYYIYLETYRWNKGKIARLMSPMQSSGQYCLTFWYSMYGGDIGAINVYIEMNDGNKTVIFSKDKDIGVPDWWKSVSNINAFDSYQIVFEGINGDGNRGNIAIDDISIRSGSCSIDCDFDTDFCNWMQSDGDNFNWDRGKGRVTSDTGPNADKTSGRGHYIYIDTSYRKRHDTAILLSPLQDAGKYCLSFWYYMYGSNSVRLRLQIWNTIGSERTMFSIESALGHQQWFQKMIFLYSEDVFQIAVEGRANYWWASGIIAMDDVTLFSCQDCTDLEIANAVIKSSNYEYGSVVKIQCNNGYNLVGDSEIVCKTMGNWSGTATCIPHDCGDLTIPNGTLFTPNGTRFGHGGIQKCNTGFVLIGDPNIKCTANGWSNRTAYCNFMDCGNFSIPNGKLLTPSGTTFGQVGRKECNTGFILNGEPNVRCTLDGWSNNSANCRLVDCGYFSIPNGKLLTPNGTTFGQVGRKECNTGFILNGEQNVRCTINGWTNTTAYCRLVEVETNSSSPLIVVYVLVPVVFIMIAATFTVVYMRRRHLSCMKVLKTFRRAREVPSGDSLQGESHSNQMYSNENLQLDDEYATISGEQTDDNNLGTVYYATVDRSGKKKPGVSKEDNQTKSTDYNKSACSIDLNECNTYNVLSAKSLNKNLQGGEEHDLDYDSACTRRMKTEASNHDDYSHMGDLEMKYQHTQHFLPQPDIEKNTDYSHIDRVSNKEVPERLETDYNDNDDEYQHSVVKEKKKSGKHTPKIKQIEDQEETDYYNVAQIKDMYESNKSENHDNFILEKTYIQ
ncbi:uncharacterized protein LOC132724541, partial [Ruditapes philippinarum]|uniref:uncharacterized protein LOC132724541 n=1 Tax=Ruditapes philippinarum TaxID=129788 RepID=UPI00295B3E31